MNFQKSAGYLAVAEDMGIWRRWFLPFLHYWLPPFLLTIGILLMAGDWGAISKLRLPIKILEFLLPSYSPKEIYQLYAVLRKVGHFLVYAALYAVYVRAWRWQVGLGRWPAVLLTLLICLVVSTADESRQALFTLRTGSPRDVLLDMSGALTAAIAFFPFLQQET